MCRKQGNITTTITLIVSLGFLVILTVYVVNTIIPFIWYQKLQAVANKYVYVIEKFGYLTESEEKELYNDLKDEGFDVSKIKLECPKSQLEYGSLFEFELTYNLEQEYGVIASGIKKEARTVSLSIKKYGYSKI